MPPVDGSPFTHVIDLTGETYFSRSEDLQISRTLNISVSIATAASQRNIKAYVRVLPPFYDHKGGNREKRKEGFKEDEEAGWKPLGSRGIWWHEMVRAIGAIPDLPLVVLRIGLAYGPNFLGFESKLPGSYCVPCFILNPTSPSHPSYSSRSGLQENRPRNEASLVPQVTQEYDSYIRPSRHHLESSRVSSFVFVLFPR